MRLILAQRLYVLKDFAIDHQVTCLFLQDVVVVHAIPHLKTSKLFNHALFHGPEFLQLEEQLLIASRTEPTPQDVQLNQVVPIISDRLQDLPGRLSVFNGMKNRLSQQLHTIQQDASSK